MRTRLPAAVLATLALATGVAQGGPERGAGVPATLTVFAQGGGRVVSEPAGAIDCGSRCAVELVVGATLALVAVPAPGNELRAWQAGCEGRSLRCELVIEGSTSVAATFAPREALPTPKILDVTRSEGGTVVSDPAGLVDCGRECTAGWTGGGPVTLRARPSSGFRFAGWVGDCVGDDDACRLDLAADRDATALFQSVSIPDASSDLTIRNRDPATGTVGVQVGFGVSECPPDCTFDVVNGTHVTLAPSAGALRSWGGGCVGTADVCRLVIASATTVDASFRPVGSAPSFAVAVSRSGNGTITSTPPGIECGPSARCAAAFGDGTRVRLQAAAASELWVFDGWRGDCSGREACTVVTDAARSVAAAFRLRRRTVRVETAGRGRGTVVSDPAGIACPPDCSFAFPSGVRVTLGATAARGSAFAGWAGACTGEVCAVAPAGAASAEAVARVRFDRCASLDFRGFVVRQARPRRLRVSLVLTGTASVRLALRRGRDVVAGRRTGTLAPGTRTVSLALPRRATGSHTLRVTVVDGCGRASTRSRTLRLR